MLSLTVMGHLIDCDQMFQNVWQARLIIDLPLHSFFQKKNKKTSISTSLFLLRIQISVCFIQCKPFRFFGSLFKFSSWVNPIQFVRLFAVDDCVGAVSDGAGNLQTNRYGSLPSDGKRCSSRRRMINPSPFGNGTLNSIVSFILERLGLSVVALSFTTHWSTSRSAW